MTTIDLENDRAARISLDHSKDGWPIPVINVWFISPEFEARFKDWAEQNFDWKEALAALISHKENFRITDFWGRYNHRTGEEDGRKIIAKLELKSAQKFLLWLYDEEVITKSDLTVLWQALHEKQRNKETGEFRVAYPFSWPEYVPAIHLMDDAHATPDEFLFGSSVTVQNTAIRTSQVVTQYAEDHEWVDTAGREFIGSKPIDVIALAAEVEQRAQGRLYI